ncbi:MAG: hypothetical protein HYS13_17710 [Planctomycetia bacterium]|nr:hypothetical protein [Planctomycetia bacterium]
MQRPDRGDNLQETLQAPPPKLVKVEANLLRLPLFALSTKGLRNLDGLEINSTLTRQGRTRQFTLRVTRNTATPYPGPLARAAHLAFLSILTERGFPCENPITWNWRDLCRRIGIAYSGRTAQHLKRAIQSTAGLMIHSEDALYSKASGQPIRTPRGVVLHLYETVAFVHDPLPDGREADANYLWLSPWYLENLNAYFTAPLDHDFWRFLDRRSTIASRLYEFLLLNFYSGTDLLRLNYPTLAQFMPLRPKRHFSEAQRQLDPAFRLLAAQKVLRDAVWQRKPAVVAELRLRPGERLATRSRLLPGGAIQEQFANAFQVRELRNLQPPEWGIVRDFYERWAPEVEHRPTPKELALARLLIDEHGQAKAKSVVPVVVASLRQRWPEAKTFGAIVPYLPDAIREVEGTEQRTRDRRRNARRMREEEEARSREKERQTVFRLRWQPRWQALSEADRHEIESAVLKGNPHLRKAPGILESLCLRELAQRSEADSAEN